MQAKTILVDTSLKTKFIFWEASFKIQILITMWKNFQHKFGKTRLQLINFSNYLHKNVLHYFSNSLVLLKKNLTQALFEIIVCFLGIITGQSSVLRETLKRDQLSLDAQAPQFCASSKQPTSQCTFVAFTSEPRCALP